VLIKDLNGTKDEFTLCIRHSSLFANLKNLQELDENSLAGSFSVPIVGSEFNSFSREGREAQQSSSREKLHAYDSTLNVYDVTKSWCMENMSGVWESSLGETN
jgi:hypothetical protein